MDGVKVGDVVGWPELPDRAVGLAHGAPVHRVCESLRIAFAGTIWTAPWRYAAADQVTVIALNVPADATADCLRALAERFEVRQYLTYGDPNLSTVENFHHAVEQAAWPYIDIQDGETHRAIKDRAADALHAAKWRPGMTAEDAARLLREAGAK